MDMRAKWTCHLLILTLAIGLSTAERGVAAEAGDSPGDQEQLRLIAPAGDDDARTTAIGLGSLARLKIEDFDFDLVWSGGQEDPLTRLLEEDIDLGLVPLARAAAEAPDLRAVMTFRPLAEDGAAADDRRLLLVAKAGLTPARVTTLLQAVQEDRFILKTAKVDVASLAPAQSMAALPLALHPGTLAYLEAEGIAPPEPGRAAVARLEPGAPEAPDLEPDNPVDDAGAPASSTIRSFTLYFDTDEAKLDPGDFTEVAAACRFAATLPAARFVISGHTDPGGSEAYNDQLSTARAAAVAAAIRNDPRFRDALSLVDFGERKLAVATADEVAESMNRRVEIQVMVPEE
jgi:outer membrane protein OmpA-like peptidoglycan-associated protein